MSGLLEFLATLALVAAGIEIMIGALKPAEAFRRVGAVLVLLLIVPALIAGLIRSVITPMLANLASLLKDAAYLVATLAAFALLGWVVIRWLQGAAPKRRRTGEE